MTLTAVPAAQRGAERVGAQPQAGEHPFDPEYGEDALHFTYNYPQLRKLLP